MGTGRADVRLLAVLVALWLMLLVPAAVSAMPGPASFSTGVVDEALFQNPVPGVRSLWFGRAQSLGSTWVRMRANWYQIAPAQPVRGFDAANAADPGYSWPSLDASIRSAAGHRQTIILQLIAAPRWALGRGAPSTAAPDSWRPSPAALGAFAHAIAQRYSGRFPDPLRPGHALPVVTHFQVWNEPNLPTYLSPQWTRGRNGSFVPASPALYRALLNAAYAGIKAVQPHAFVLAAGTGPYGDPPGGGRMPPVVFLRELLCLHGAALRPERCPAPAHFDALDHHPYSATPTIHAFSPDDVSVPDLGRLQRILAVARRTHRLLPRGPKPIWITEISWDSDPPDRHSAISTAAQARYLALTFYELWRQGVGHVLWFTFQDIPYQLLTGSGLYFRSGAAKPSAVAFRFPFVALRGARGNLTVWGRAPHAGAVEIEVLGGRRWRGAMRLRTTSGGVFYVIVRRPGRVTLRAVQGQIAGLGWATS